MPATTTKMAAEMAKARSEAALAAWEAAAVRRAVRRVFFI
jgi:hypothetical protein